MSAKIRRNQHGGGASTQPTSSNHVQEPDSFLRIGEIIGYKKRGIKPLIPVSPTTWWGGVKSGRYPPDIRLSERTTAWRK